MSLLPILKCKIKTRGGEWAGDGEWSEKILGGEGKKSEGEKEERKERGTLKWRTR